jgi:3-methyl-2-oxobutanoate hydroxymethyltransferase
MVLELVQPALATEITRRVLTPTIGIGSGTGCDGQILVTHDLIGAFPWFRPGFVSPKLDSASLIQGAVKGWRQEQSQIYQTFLAQDPSPDSA